MKHLSDNQILNYLDDEYQPDQSEIENHFKNCIDCQLSLNEYQGLYKALQKQSIPILSGNFSKNIISRLNESKDRKWRIFENTAIVFIMIAGFFSIIYFSYLFNITGYFKAIDFSAFLDTVNYLNFNFFGKLSYILMAVIVTIIVELIDLNFVKKSRRQPGH